MGDIPNYFIVGGIKHVVKSQGDFHNAQIWPYVTTNCTVPLQDQLAHFRGQLLQLR